MLLSEFLSEVKNSRYLRFCDSLENKRIMIDLDKTIHKYSEGYKDGSVYDEPIKGAREIISRLRKDGFKVWLLTARLTSEGGEHQEEQIKLWLLRNGIVVDGITGEKLPALLYIDDRGMEFDSSEKWNESFYKEILERISTTDQLPSINFQGIKIDIENKKGSVRKGEDEDGSKWETKMFYPYGFIRNTEGSDGDEIDVFVGPNKDSDKVFVIRNMIDGNYDEDKCFVGFEDKLHARDAFLAHYDDSSHLGEIKEINIEDFKKLLKEHNAGTRIEE